MAAPALKVAIQGFGELDADNCNSYEQTCDTAAELLDFIGAPGVQVLLRGIVAVNDGGGGIFYWNAAGVANDGFANFAPIGAAVGCWTRLTLNTEDVTTMVTGASAILSSLDVNFVVNKTVGSATALLLPPLPFQGEIHTITDGKGDAASNNITISGNGNTISGASTKIISSAYGSRTVQFVGGQWLLIGSV